MELLAMMILAINGTNLQPLRLVTNLAALQMTNLQKKITMENYLVALAQSLFLAQPSLANFVITDTDYVHQGRVKNGYATYLLAQKGYPYKKGYSLLKMLEEEYPPTKYHTGNQLDQTHDVLGQIFGEYLRPNTRPRCPNVNPEENAIPQISQYRSIKEFMTKGQQPLHQICKYSFYICNRPCTSLPNYTCCCPWYKMIKDERKIHEELG
jgi:hypothetical protein